MNKTVQRCLFIVVFVGVIVVSLSAPWVLSDKNSFLRSFVGNPILSLIGVIVTIALASAANLHLRFNDIEDRAGRRILINTRRKVHSASYWMIATLIAVVVLLVTKSLIGSGDIATSLVNGLALVALLANILILLDLTMIVYAIDPNFESFPPQTSSRVKSDKTE